MAGMTRNIKLCCADCKNPKPTRAVVYISDEEGAVTVTPYCVVCYKATLRETGLLEGESTSAIPFTINIMKASNGKGE